MRQDSRAEFKEIVVEPLAARQRQLELTPGGGLVGAEGATTRGALSGMWLRRRRGLLRREVA